jgi:hypothetical protein
MESCISCLIDLHSSDDPEIYQVPPSSCSSSLPPVTPLQVFRTLRTLEALRETSSIFRNKVLPPLSPPSPSPQLKGEANALERVEVQKCKETLLNLNRFVKYKASPPAGL